MTEWKRKHPTAASGGIRYWIRQWYSGCTKGSAGGTIKEMMEAEIDAHLGYEKSERSDNEDSRNGYKAKQINAVMAAWKSTFHRIDNHRLNLRLWKKDKRTSQILTRKSFRCIPKEWRPVRFPKRWWISMVSRLQKDSFPMLRINKIMSEIEDWQNRPLSAVYPVIYIAAIHYSARDNGIIRKIAAYVILEINTDGYKEVLTIRIDENESSKYWLSVFMIWKTVVQKIFWSYVRMVLPA